MIVLKDLFSSKKFLVMMAAIIIMAADKLGLNLDPDFVNKLLAIVGAYIVGQGIADHGKEAAKIEAAAAVPTATTTVVDTTDPMKAKTTTIVEAAAKTTTLALLIGVPLIASSTGCSWLKSEGASAGKAAVSCMTSTAKSQIKQYGSMVEKTLVDAVDPSTRQVNWSPVKDLTKDFLVDGGMCVLASAIARITNVKAVPGAPQSAPVDVDANSLLSGFRSMSSGKAYETEYGTVQ